MEIAILEARKAFARDEVPVGAVIIDSNSQIIAKTGNQTEKKQDPTAHAEMEVIRKACSVLGNKFLNDCSIYVTLEPCPMCAQAISAARIKSLYYGAFDPKSGGVENGTKTYLKSSCHHKPEVYSGIYETECSQLIKDYFFSKRI